MKTLDLEIKVSICPTTLDSTFERDGRFTFTTGNDFDEFLKECKESLIDELIEDKGEEHEDEIKGEFMEVDYEVEDWDEVKDYDNLQDLELLQEIAEISDLDYQDWEVISAAIYLDIPVGDINEAYVGEFGSDEEFAENLAEELGYITNDVQWPYTCIDWEHAAKELMYDYSDADNHYFRNL